MLGDRFIEVVPWLAALFLYDGFFGRIDRGDRFMTVWLMVLGASVNAYFGGWSCHMEIELFLALNKWKKKGFP